jgi:hypothetical protein
MSGSGGAPGTGGVSMTTPDAAPARDSSPSVDTIAPAPADTAPAPSPDVAPALPADSAAPPPDTAPPAPDSAPPSPDTAPPAPAACTPNSPIGCGTNQWCSKATGTCLTAMTLMRWTFSHMCPMAGDIQFRLFDDTNGGQWPAGDQVFVVPVGTQRGTDINCIAGASICFGARGRTVPVFWGADSDNSEPCTDCCAICGAGNVVTQNLVCL